MRTSALRAPIRLLVVLGLVAGLLPVVVSASFAFDVPRTLYVRMGAPDVSPGTPRAPQALPFAATHLGLSWIGDDPPEVRTSPDGISWSAWRLVEVSEDLSDHDAGLFFGTLISVDRAEWVQVRGGDARLYVSAINTRDGPRRSILVDRAASGATPGPPVISRAEWGADESLRKASPSFARVRRLFVHHTVTVNDDADPEGTIRAIYSYHTQSRGWDDIGYNFLVDSNGRVYEGRYARPDGEPSGENANGLGVVGAHVSGWNTGSAGVAVLGDFRSVMPRPAALESLVALLSWKADRHGIDPLGSADSIPNIAGHKDAGDTECPGDLLYGQLPSVRQAVDSRINALSALSSPSMPTGTQLLPAGVTKDVTPGLSGAVSRATTRVETTFTPVGGGPVRTVSVPASAGSFAVTDADYGGLPLALDTYSVRATAFDAPGRASPTAPVSGRYVVTEGEVPSGYWVMGSDGGIFSYGSAPFLGSTGGMRLNSPAVAMDVSTPRGVGGEPGGVPGPDGYWMVAADGGVFAFGSAGFSGSMGGTRLNEPIVDMGTSTGGEGYWMVASDGGLFAFGDAAFHGSTGGLPLNRPIVGMAPTPTGAGYWLVASDGGVFAFGDAAFHGSTGGIRLNRPIAGMAPTPSGQGYWLVGEDGGVFAFGDASFLGSAAGTGMSAVRVASTATGRGYYVLGSGGSLNAYGDAPYYGSPWAGGLRITALDLALAP
ncbi:MAG: N-acetylmuramoyl-L-alanine amidase [Actinomycetota bacterium]